MIRHAMHSDVAGIVALGARMHAESNYASVPYGAERVARFIGWLLKSEYGCAVISQSGGELTGFVLAIAMPAWFGNGVDKIAEELVLYVAPHARQGRAALGLTQALKTWAVAQGVKQLRAGTSAGAAGHGADRLYAHQGFECVGRCFLLDFTAVDAQRDAA